MKEDQAFIESVASKITTVFERGVSLIHQIPKMLKGKEEYRLSPGQLEALQADKRVLKRRYTVEQAAKLAGISHTTLYAAEKDGRLPEPDYRSGSVSRKIRAGYTIDQINFMRDVFDTRPSKPKGLPAAIVGILNLKGGSHKTTNCHLLSQNLAIQGYKILVVDTDPQGSLSFYYGLRPDIDVEYEDTIAPYMLEDDDSLKDGDFEYGTRTLHYAVKKTYWSNIDIIPSCLQNLSIDMMMPRVAEASGMSEVDKLMKLREGLLGIADDYDFIIVDGTPSLNISTLNVLSACDMIFVPTPAAMLDFASTLQFTNLIGETIEAYKNNNIFPNIPDVRYFITKFSKTKNGSGYAEFMAMVIRKVFTVEEGDVLHAEAYHSDEIGKSANRITSIYEVNPSDADNRKRLKETCEIYDRLFKEMHDAIWDFCFDTDEKETEVNKSLIAAEQGIDELLKNDPKAAESVASIRETTRQFINANTTEGEQ